jgi:hypothetical protein
MAIDREAAPDATGCPLTLTEAFGSVVVGVTVSELVEDVTDAE